MKILILILAVFFMAVQAEAIDLEMAWNASANADSYKLYMSTDLGQSWSVGVDVGNVLTYVYPAVPDTGMVLFRVSAYNSQGEAVSYDRGAWYNRDFAPPAPAAGFGIN